MEDEYKFGRFKCGVTYKKQSDFFFLGFVYFSLALIFIYHNNYYKATKCTSVI